jgi:hypothetical protein
VLLLQRSYFIPHHFERLEKKKQERALCQYLYLCTSSCVSICTLVRAICAFVPAAAAVVVLL